MEIKAEPDEVTISLPCGNIAGKWWGPKHIRPILCLHGWQDNAGTFDTLIPLLPQHVSYLAIDLPGHGLSFRYPSGIMYNYHDLTYIVRLIADLYKWKKISFLAHSMGVFPVYIYAGIFPQEVDLVIALDAIQPLCINVDRLYTIMKRCITDNVKFEKIIATAQEPPCYSYNEMVLKTIEGSFGSVTVHTAAYLLKRGMAQSTKDPTKYYFTRDIRVKHGLFRINDLGYCKYLASYMTMPFLYIKGKDSPYYEPKQSRDETINALVEFNPNFQFQLVEGNHHVHLTNPDRVSGFICDIILRIRPSSSGTDVLNKNYHVNCKL